MGINLSEVNLAYLKEKKQYKYAIKDINLRIDNEDEFIAIVGHTGSGKSTLVQVLNNLLVPTFGHISINFRENNNDVYYNIKASGKKVKYAISKDNINFKYKARVSLKALRKHIGLVFQFPEYQIFEETVLKDIMFGPKNFLRDENKAKEEAIKIAEMMNISDLLDKSPFMLSGGQMRKVAIAGILASKPEVLVLDEPTVGLEYAKRTIVLNKGCIMYDGSKDEMFRNEEVIKSCNLNYPNIVKILAGLKAKLNIDLDIYKYNIDDAFKELNRVLGDNHE